MKTIFLSLLSLCSFLLIVSPSSAEGNRYTMTPTADGFLRLDTQTGAVSICNKDGGQWDCKGLDKTTKSTSTNETTGRMSELIAENKELKLENKRLEDELVRFSKNGAKINKQEFQLPSEEDVDKVMNFMERMIDRLKKFGNKLSEDDEKLGTPL